jgi:biopolymer transport protein ExbD
MTWKIRHEGSPRSIDDLSVAQVVEGLQDGLWAPTDEVMGPSDRHWIAIENHPQFVEAAADLEPPQAPDHEDETRLDMNPLIDVALVLLIFFILTTSYATLQKLLETPDYTSHDVEGDVVHRKGPPPENVVIKVRALQENGKSVFFVENQRVDEKSLLPELARYSRATHRTQLLIDAADDLDWGSVVAIEDAAKGAGIERAYFLNKRKPATAPPRPSPPA